MWSIFKRVPIFLPILLFCGVEAITVQDINEMDPVVLSENGFVQARGAYVDENENCGPRDLEMVRNIMDRICILCHELHSHVEGNTRAMCRKDCFNNKTFRFCTHIFSGKPRNIDTNSVEPTAPVPLYTEDFQTLDDVTGNDPTV